MADSYNAMEMDFFSCDTYSLIIDKTEWMLKVLTQDFWVRTDAGS